MVLAHTAHSQATASNGWVTVIHSLCCCSDPLAAEAASTHPAAPGSGSRRSSSSQHTRLTLRVFFCFLHWTVLLDHCRCCHAPVDVPEAIRLWPLAANMAACHVAGIALGWLQVRALNTPASLASQVTVMTALGNVGE